MSDELPVDVVETHGRLAVVAVAGELDMTTAPDMYVQATAVLAAHPDLVLDLSGITFCDSSGFNALLRLNRRVREAGGQFALAAPTLQISSLLALTGVEGVFDVHGSRAEAVAAAERPDPGRDRAV